MLEPIVVTVEVAASPAGANGAGEIAPILRREYIAGWRGVLGDFYARYAGGAS